MVWPLVVAGGPLAIRGLMVGSRSPGIGSGVSYLAAAARRLATSPMARRLGITAGAVAGTEVAMETILGGGAIPGLGGLQDIGFGGGAGGPGIVFVRTWSAGAANFAIDQFGNRWVFRNKLGIWKRSPYVRNIVISGKDVKRARRLIRKSRQLQAIRHGLGDYSTRQRRTTRRPGRHGHTVRSNR